MKTKKNAATLHQISFKEKNKRSGGLYMRNRIKSIAVSVIRGLLMFGLCFMIIQPLITRFATSLMVETDLYDSTIVLLPRTLTLENYKIVADLTGFPNSMIATLWTSLLVAVLQVVSCTLIAYGFARYEFPLKKFWFACVILLIIVPPATIQTALYSYFNSFDVFGIVSAVSGSSINLRTSIVPYALMSITTMGLKNGLYIFMLRQYFKGIPKSLEEAAYMDGCGTMHTFCKIMLPDAMPTILSCFLFAFVWQWTDIFYTRNFLSTYNTYSYQLSSIVTRMSRYFANNEGQAVIVPTGRTQQLVSIGILVCCIPLIILYCFTQRTFVESLAMTGSKE